MQSATLQSCFRYATPWLPGMPPDFAVSGIMARSALARLHRAATKPPLAAIQTRHCLRGARLRKTCASGVVLGAASICVSARRLRLQRTAARSCCSASLIPRINPPSAPARRGAVPSAAYASYHHHHHSRSGSHHRHIHTRNKNTGGPARDPAAGLRLRPPPRWVPCRAGVLEGFSGVSNLMAPETATIFSAIIAITSVSINLYGGLLTEKRRAELAREVERERQVMAAQDEERSVVARYRGPLLEATVDLEARLYHIVTLTGEWRSGDVVCEEEVVYTLFTLAQWLGFLEVIRREGPRERSFLNFNRGEDTSSSHNSGNNRMYGNGGGSSSSSSNGSGHDGGGGGPHGGTDTLTTLVEGFRFVLSAHPATLVKWYEQGDGREHPGCRSRALMLRGTPARPDDWPAATTSGGMWRERQPLQPGTMAQSPAAAAAAAPQWSSAAAGGEGPATASYGPVRMGLWYGADQAPQCTTPPPPTKPVMLYDTQQPAGPGLGPGAGAGSELVIGSLDENDLAAAGLGLPDPLASELAAAASAAAGVAAAYGGTASGANGNGNGGGAAAAAVAAAIAAAADPHVSSLASLCSLDEGSFGPVANGGGGGGRLVAPRDVFHVSRGAQRSIGSMMVVTPMGASRHYTLSYGDFYNRYYMDDFFASWLRTVHTDILALVGGRRWTGQGPFPLNRWTRLLLLQQLLIETIELLDPAHVRVPANRRVVLAPVPYKQAPELDVYRARMAEMSQLDSPLLLRRLSGVGEEGPVGRALAWVKAAAAGVADMLSTAPPAAPPATAQLGPARCTAGSDAGSDVGWDMLGSPQALQYQLLQLERQQKQQLQRQALLQQLQQQQLTHHNYQLGPPMPPQPLESSQPAPVSLAAKGAGGISSKGSGGGSGGSTNVKQEPGAGGGLT